MAEQQPISQPRRTRLFISYSRRDIVAAEQLERDLHARGFGAYLDKNDILPGEPWRDRLGKLIEQADTVLFLLSPDSNASKICDWEVNEAERLSKRVLPVVIRDTSDISVSGRLSRLNYVFMRDADDRDAALDQLTKALLTDIAWIREHTRIGELATAWTLKRRTDALLRGHDLVDAESWISNQPSDAPAPTDLQRQFIIESRNFEEAQEKDRVKRRRTIRLGAGVAALLVVTLGLYLLHSALSALRAQSVFLADYSRRLTNEGDAATAALLAMEALPDKASDSFVARFRPHVAEAAFALNDALRNLREHQLIAGVIFVAGDAKFSHDGGRLLISETYESRLWDVSAGREISRSKHGGIGHNIDFSRDGARFVSAISDKAFAVFDSVSGNQLVRSADHAKRLARIMFSSDGLSILTYSWEDSAAWVWDAATGRERFRVALFGDGPPAWSKGEAWFGPDGNILAYLSDGSVRKFSVLDGKEILKFVGSGPISFQQLVYSRAGNVVLTSSTDQIARIWDGGTLQPMGRFPAGGIMAVAISEDGTRGILGSYDGVVQVWDLSSKRLLGTLDGHKVRVSHVALSRTGSLALAVGEDSTVRVWDMLTKNEIAHLGGHTKNVRGEPRAITSASFSPDGSRVVTTSTDGTTRIWNIKSGLTTLRFPHTLPSTDNGAALSIDGTLLVTAGDFGIVRLWDAALEKQLGKLELQDQRKSIRDVAMSPDMGLIVSASEDGTGRVWQRTKSEVLQYNFVTSLKGHTDQLNRVSFFGDSKVLTASRDGTARIWNVQSGKELVQFAGHDGDVTSAVFLPDGKRVLTTSLDKIRVWDAVSGKELNRSSMAGITNPASPNVQTASVSPDGRRAIVALADKTASILDVLSGNELFRLTGNETHVLSVAFSQDGSRVATGSLNGIVSIWSATNGQKLGELNMQESSWVTSVAFAGNNSRVLTTHSVGGARISELGSLSAQDIVDEVKEGIPRCLTKVQREEFKLYTEPPVWCYSKKKWPYVDDMVKVVN